MDVLFRVPQDHVTRLVLVLVALRSWCLALLTDGHLEVGSYGAHGGQVVVKPSHKLVIAVAWRKRLRQPEAFVVHGAELEFGGRESS